MKIIFDARWTKIGRHDGISRYGASLLEALIKLTPVTVLIHDPRQLELLPKGIKHLLVNPPVSLQELTLPRRLNALGADVVYSPMQIMGTAGRKYKLLFTLHDMIYYKYPFAPTELPAPARAFWWLFHHAYWPGRLVLNQADVVLTVSETSKSEILAAHLTDRPVEVVYNAPAHLAPGRAGNDPKPEIVFMGTLMPYKNAELLIRALEFLPEYHLHLTGRATPDRLDALKTLAAPWANRVTFWNGATDKQYAQLLDEATAMVTASKAEGFGLPLVEAMSRGVPVVCTDMAIFHEVAGNAALYFDPDSPQDCADKIRQAEQPATRARLIEAGFKQAKTFSWDKSAEKLYSVIQDLAKTPKK